MIFDSIIPLAIFTDKIEIKMIRFILKETGIRIHVNKQSRK